MLHFIAWLILGGIAGAIAGRIMSGHGYGVVVDVILGIVGGFVGGWIVRDLLHLETGGSIGIVSFITALVGACILVAILHLVRREPIRT